MISDAALSSAPISVAASTIPSSGALFTAVAFLSVGSHVVLGGKASFVGSAALSAAGKRTAYGAAGMTGLATLSGAPRLISLGAASFAGEAALTGRLSSVVFGGGSFLGTAVMTVDVNLRIFAATREFITGAGDIPANQPVHGTLQKIIRFDRSILNGGRIGQVTAGWGEMELVNAEADYDDLIEKYAVDGRPIVLKVGIEGSPYSKFLTLFSGTSADWHVEEDVLRIQVRDNTYKLEVPAQPLIYAGTGGMEGGDDLKGKRKPLAFGFNRNMTPVNLIPTELVRQVSSGPIHAIPAVYDLSVPLTLVGDFATSALLRAATTGAPGSGADIERGQYGTCLAEALYRLGGDPEGLETCDVDGDATGGIYVETTASIIRRLIGLSTQVLDPSGLFNSSFVAVEAAQPAPVQYLIESGSEETVADVIANLMAGVGGWGGMRRDGRFELGIFSPPSGQIAARYDRIDIVEIDRQKMPDGLSPPPWRFRVAWGRNHTVQTDVDGRAGMTPERLAFLREARRLETSNQAAGHYIQVNHPLAQDPEPIEGYFRDQPDARDEADRQLAMFGPTSSLYRIVLKIRPFQHEIGDVIHVTYPRWDLAAGRGLRVVSLSDDADEGRVELIGFG